MKLRSKVLYFCLLMVAMGFLNAQTVEQTAPPVGPKMDEVPPNYSVLVEFDQGGVLLVPWFLVPEREIPKNRDEKVKESWLQMVF